MATDGQDTREGSLSTLAGLIADVKIAMMTTALPDGSLRSRPMATQKDYGGADEFDGELWFFTGAASGKVDEIEGDRHVNLAYSKPGSNTYVSVSGLASVVRDKAKAKELWNPIYKAWFPKGLDDPDLALLRVAVTRGEYWDSPSGTVVQLAGFIKAVVTGEKAKGKPGEHGTVELGRGG